MIAAYGVSNLLQSIAVNREQTADNLHPSLLAKLATQPVYLLGLLCQIAGFVLAFLAREDLPLFLVQACMTAGLGVTAILGVFVLKWRLPSAEVALLGLLGVGLVGLVVSAKPAPSKEIGWVGIALLVLAFAGIAVAGVFATRLSGVRASITLGCLAGLNFGAAALASRPLANVSQPVTFLTDPLLYLLIVHSLSGSLLLAIAMQRGSTMAAIAGMDAAAAVPAAALGLLFLGDQIVPGLEWLAAAGFCATLVAVLALTRYSEPQPTAVVRQEQVAAELSS
ncbi:hypothetical protein [Longispora albida]|uniref:hypothetical protein n=1 Tax=Longispora albida TaxID=203523 RepID=UPI00036CA884|nr:hypothetical protein [Longispora albida]